MMGKKQTQGFTIVELLIVIVVIAILATITLVTYNGIQLRARDSRRAQDMSTIEKALLMYQTLNGGVPKTSTYSSSGPGGWDISTNANWLAFLTASYGKMPVDPTNTGTADPMNTYELTYFYFCYPPGSGLLPATSNVRLGYWSEQTKTQKNYSFAVDSCL